MADTPGNTPSPSQPPSPAEKKIDDSILTLYTALSERAEALDKALETLVANRTGENIKGSESNRQAKDADAAYKDLHYATASIYGELRSAVGLETGFAEFSPTFAPIAGAPVKTLVGTSVRATLSMLLMNSTKAKMDKGWTSAVSDPDERAIDKNIAKKLDAERKARIQQLEAEKNSANVDLIEQLKKADFLSLIQKTDSKIAAVDEHYQERWQRAALVGWVNSSRHSEEVSAGGNPFKMLFDHPRFHAYAEMGADGKVSAQVTQIPLFSSKGKLFAAGQLLGAYYETLIQGVPEYEMETVPKKDKDGNIIYKKDADDNPTKEPETEEVIAKENGQPKIKYQKVKDKNGHDTTEIKRDNKGRPIPVYKYQTPSEAHNEPFPLGSVPSGFPDEGFTFLCNIVAIAQYEGRQVNGMGPDGPTEGLLNTLTNGMQPNVKAAFLQRVHNNWKQGLQAAEQRVEKHIVQPQLRKMFISELSQEKKAHYGDKTVREQAEDWLKTSFLGKGVNKVVGSIPVRAIRESLTLEATGKTSLSKDQQTVIQNRLDAFQKKREARDPEATKAVELLVKGRFEDVMGGSGSGIEAQQVNKAKSGDNEVSVVIEDGSAPPPPPANDSSMGVQGAAGAPGASPEPRVYADADQAQSQEPRVYGADATQAELSAKVRIRNGLEDDEAAPDAPPNTTNKNGPSKSSKSSK